MSSTNKAKSAVINWIKANDPNLYALAVKRHALQNSRANVYALSEIEEDAIENLSGVADFFKTMGTTISSVIPQAIQYKTQKDILKAQLKRGEQGLPPFDVRDYSPVLRVSPDFSPESEAALTRMAIQTTGTGINKILPFAIGGIALVLLLRRRN